MDLREWKDKSETAQEGREISDGGRLGAECIGEVPEHIHGMCEDGATRATFRAGRPQAVSGKIDGDSFVP